MGSSALLVIATFLVAECTQYWQFLLCQGLAVGASHLSTLSFNQATNLIFFKKYKQLGCGGIFSPTTAVIAHWFKKRRGLAMGYVAAGSSVGGTLFPILAKSLIPMVG